MHTLLLSLYSMFYIAVVYVFFDQSSYSINENGRPFHPALMLSNPSAIDITVQVADNGNTATG